MAHTKENDVFLTSEKKKSPRPKSKTCHLRWWRQEYHHQEAILKVIESFKFRALIIFLVIADTGLIIGEIMLDSYKIHLECKNKNHQPINHHDKIAKERIELAMEILHYTSIGILTFFVIELLFKIYAFGKEFWNIRRKKMEYFDAFIVISSLIIDLVFLSGEERVLGEKLLLILSFRLWRFVRIVSSVSEAIRHGQKKHKRNLNSQYLIAIERLIAIIVHKTTYAEDNNQDMNLILEHFHMIDDQCKLSTVALNENRELTSSVIVAQFNEDINGLENKNHNCIVAAMLLPPPRTLV